MILPIATASIILSGVNSIVGEPELALSICEISIFIFILIITIHYKPRACIWIFTWILFNLLELYSVAYSSYVISSYRDIPSIHLINMSISIVVINSAYILFLIILFIVHLCTE